MYTSFFGLKENPFNLTPDPRYLYLSPQHQEALNYLVYGINERKGFIVITGGIGTGKTTLCRALLANLDPSVETALIFNPSISDIELLQAINQEFAIAAEAGRGKKHYIDALNLFLLGNFSAGKNAMVLIDEAQNLSPETLEQIRMLSNLETEREKLLQIVLVGQPEFKNLLESPALRQLNERITVRYELKALHEADVDLYIRHRLMVGGADGEKLGFTPAASRRIYRLSQGVPRRINAICDRSLLIAYAGYQKGIFHIDERTVANAADDIKGKKTETGFLKRVFILLLFFLVFMLSLILVYGAQMSEFIPALNTS